MSIAQRDHSFSTPAIPPSREEPIPIQYVDQQIIRTDRRQRAHRFDNVLRRLRAVLTTSPSRQSQLGMDPALLVNDEEDFARLGIHIHNNFLN